MARVLLFRRTVNGILRYGSSRAAGGRAMPEFRSNHAFRRSTRPRFGAWAVAVLLLLVALPQEAHASLFSPELEDKLATFIALFVLFVVPVVLIVAFWLVHILPEQIAHKRNHPQFEAIRTLCLLSLVFGGLLWPIAWLWAYSKPVMHKTGLRHGQACTPKTRKVAARRQGRLGLHERLARLEAQGVPPSELKALSADLEALESKFVGQGAR